MIFQHTLPMVLDGTKTQTRRPFKDSDGWVRDPNNLGKYLKVIRNDRTLWEVGKTYAVQPGRGKHGVARILITGIRIDNIVDISDVDLAAEGNFDGREFISLWCEMHGTDNLLAWILEFELANRTGE